MNSKDSLYKEIKGIDKITEIKNNFVWSDIQYIRKLNYYIDINEFGEEISYLEIVFLLECDNQKFKEICIKFNDVINFNINSLGGNYNQIAGFEIINKRELGWEYKYEVLDYEQGLINFFCNSIEIL